MKFNLNKLNDGRIFSVTFIKADGSTRKMLARTGVCKNLKNNPRYNPANYNLLVVWSMRDNAYRSINIDRIQEVKANGVLYSKLT
jgi:hypothetical protein